MSEGKADGRVEISVIVPVYNVEPYLDTCFTSLLGQTFTDFEIIIVDDGSTDRSGKICDEYAAREERIHVYHKTNGGLSDARNYGVPYASGKYISFLDSDDFVDADYLEYLYTLIKKYQTQVSICQIRVLHESGNVEDPGREGDTVMSGKEALEKMLYHDTVDTAAYAKLYERSLLDEIQYPVGKIFEDIGTTYQFFLKCSRIAVGYASKHNYIYRSNSIVNCAFNLNKLDLLEMTDKMASDVIGVYPDLADAVMRRRVYARFSTLNQMRNTDEYPEKKKEIIEFIKENSRSVMQNPKAPRRDKIAISALRMGYGFYKRAWAYKEGKK